MGVLVRRRTYETQILGPRRWVLVRYQFLNTIENQPPIMPYTYSI